ncbi:hypothetical protein [Polaribacter sp. KT 15]|uniref:hypothetical protein n=1 Tax=Polaribacter sp. KT 15 TaxID=1896175 RepID=UPI00090B0600|nr:hypothetical protein [Polaribacter sp. KT 15]SHN04795.1 hypothetical protein SAMN05720268_2421 [Polaribacter sp. KT 15]
MKQSLVLLFLFISLSLTSQSIFNSYEEGKIYFRDSTQTKGLIKITSSDKIKFKKTKNDKKEILDYKTVRMLKFIDGTEYIYKLSKKTNKILLIKRAIEGKLNLYSFEVTNNSLPGMGMAPGLSITFGLSNSRTVYYIGSNESDFMEKLPNNPKSKKFKKIISKYTSDCKNFIELIKDKKSVINNFENKNSRVEDIIKYYNANCK